MKWHPGHATSSVAWCLQWSCASASRLPEMLSIRPPHHDHHHGHRGSWRRSPSGHHAVATTGPRGQGILLTSWARRWICRAAGGHLGDRSRSQAATSSTSWLQAGLAFTRCPTSSVPRRGVFVGVTVPPRQPPGPVPAAEDKGWTTSPGEAGSGPLHHPKVAGATRRRSLGQRPR